MVTTQSKFINSAANVPYYWKTTKTTTTTKNNNNNNNKKQQKLYYIIQNRKFFYTSWKSLNSKYRITDNALLLLILDKTSPISSIRRPLNKFPP